jgi:hypothetical protein
MKPLERFFFSGAQDDLICFIRSHC